MSAEAERIRQSGAHLLLNIAVYAVVEVAFLVGYLIAHSCVDKSLLNGLCADDSLYAACRAEEMTRARARFPATDARPTDARSGL